MRIYTTTAKIHRTIKRFIKQYITKKDENIIIKQTHQVTLEKRMKQGIYYSSLIPGLLFIGMSLSFFP
jgi:hypothetical protein